MNNFDFSVLTSEDILYAALGAVLITWVIKIIMKLNKIIKNPMSLLDKSEDLRQVNRYSPGWVFPLCLSPLDLPVSSKSHF